MPLHEIPQRDQRIGRPIAHRLERTKRLVDRFERHFPRLDAVPSKPAAGGSVKAAGFGVCQERTDRRRIGQRDARQLGGCMTDQVKVAKGERAAKACIAVALRGHEHMFA